MAEPKVHKTLDNVSEAVRALREGGVIAYPTEAVWGLGCDPRNSEAVRRVCALKQRPLDKGLLLVGSKLAQVEPLLQALGEDQAGKIRTSWPGPVTWVLPNVLDFSEDITGGRDTVAVRISAHPAIIALCDQFNGLIVSTSANLSGEPPARTNKAVQRVFSKKLDYVYDCGSTGQNLSPSQIFDGKTGRRLR